MTREELVNYLVRSGVLKTEHIINAFKAIDRADFVPEHWRKLAYEDTPLPIGYGATISQPYVVAFMLELLEPKPGDKILDIGSGSGWTTALLAHAVTQNGRVFAIERIPELQEFGEKNCAKYNFVKKGIAEFICGDGSKGLSAKAPFDAIHAGAALQNSARATNKRRAAFYSLPLAWRKQLKIGGRIVTPIGGSIWRFTKQSAMAFDAEEYYGFEFVPLVKE
jgi:protein-L-isoaspartate(D-aspartate) O-methyltransferase